MANKSTAQTTKGIIVGYASNKPTKLSDITAFPDITETPSLAGTINTVDVTPLSNTNNHVYIAGLSDMGGVMEFPALFTKELQEAVDAAKVIDEAGELYIVIEYPLPVGKMFYFEANIVELAPDAASVDAALTANLRVTPISDIEHADLPTE